MGRGGSVYKPGRLEPRRYLGRYPGRRLRPPLPARAPLATWSPPVGCARRLGAVVPAQPGRYYRPPLSNGSNGCIGSFYLKSSSPKC
jgi:hypothetical protein